MIFMDEDPDDEDDSEGETHLKIMTAETIDYKEFSNETLNETNTPYQENRDKIGMEMMWNQVDRTISSVPPSSDDPFLHHVAGTLLLVKRKQDLGEGEQEEQEVSITMYQGTQQTDMFAGELKLSTSMFDDHMPWGYDQVFQGENSLKKWET